MILNLTYILGQFLFKNNVTFDLLGQLLVTNILTFGLIRHVGLNN